MSQEEAELRERQKAIAAFEVWAAARLEECRVIVFRERKPSIVVNHLLDEIDRDSRTMHLVEMRVLNIALRILRGEPAPELNESGTYGCSSCDTSMACFDGSVECQKRN